MFNAIHNEIDKINNPDSEISGENKDIELEQEYAKLQEIKIDLENLDTNTMNDYLTDDDFDKLKDLVASGNSLTEAYRNILPVDLVPYTKDTIQKYENELIRNIMDSDNAEEYREGLNFIIDGLSTIYEGKEISFKELKDMFDTKYN